MKQLKLKTILQNMGRTMEGRSDGLKIAPNLVAVDILGLGEDPNNHPGDLIELQDAQCLSSKFRVNFYCLQPRILLDVLTLLW